jgi:hypothetical protein
VKTASRPERRRPRPPVERQPPLPDRAPDEEGFPRRTSACPGPVVAAQRRSPARALRSWPLLLAESATECSFAMIWLWASGVFIDVRSRFRTTAGSLESAARRTGRLGRARSFGPGKQKTGSTPSRAARSSRFRKRPAPVLLKDLSGAPPRMLNGMFRLV